MTDTRTLPADPDGMNDACADWAAHALRSFREVCRGDPEDALADLLCNFMHLCDRDGHAYGDDFEAALSRARFHYAAETQEL